MAITGIVGVLAMPLWLHLTMSVAKMGIEGSALATALGHVCVPWA
jgi:Na+-driven multidrug efflux pump